MTMIESTRPPDVDRDLHYQSFGSPQRRTAKCRLRVWVVEHTVVVTELDDNPGASVTNSIEAIAEAVDAILGIDLGDDEGEWRLIEHYPANGLRGPTIDRVSFGLRDRRGKYAVPTWKRLAEADAAWLYEALR